MRRSLVVELLERREVYSADSSLPFGAMPQDTGEFFLGRVAVTPVLLESNGQIDANVENWRADEIQVVRNRIAEGMQWWVDLLGTQTSVHDLEFVIDSRYATTPFPTPYEPISRISNDYTRWVQQFLKDVGADGAGGLESDMRAFNNAQRERLNADWAFTIFVVDAELDPDGGFAPGGDFSRAFAFAGGLFQVVPSGRPASTYTHETGHMFWARDEYEGGGNWSQRRGYYNSQNLNAWDNPTPGFVQAPGIMVSGTLLTEAYEKGISPQATLAQLGWQDSDGDGVFDVLDVPLRLEGTGRFDPALNRFRFVGSAAVQTLPNRNPAGLRNDITLNELSRLQYRIDGGPWQTAVELHQSTASLDVSFAVPAFSTIGLRVIDDATGVTSPELTVPRDQARRLTRSGAHGAVWLDLLGDGQWNSGDPGLANARIDVVDASGQPVLLKRTVEPDDYNGQLPSIDGVQLVAIGPSTDGRIGAFANNRVSTGSKSFRYWGTDSSSWLQGFSPLRQMRVNFATPTTSVELDAIGLNSGADYGRLEAYDQSGKLLARSTTGPLGVGSFQTMRVESLEGEIAYVIVGGHMGTSVGLDHLRWGAGNTANSDGLGGFALPALADGTYQLKISLDNPNLQTAGGDQQSVTIIDGVATGPVNFRFVPTGSRYQNPNERLDVDANGAIEALDALLVINALNRGRGPDLAADTTPAPPFVDVDGNNRLEPLDSLLIINYLNRLGGSGEGELRRHAFDQGDQGGLPTIPSNLAAIGTSSTTPSAPSDASAGLSPPAATLADAAFASLSLAEYLAQANEFETPWGPRRRR